MALYNLHNKFIIQYFKSFALWKHHVILNHILNSLNVFDCILELIKPLVNLYRGIFHGTTKMRMLFTAWTLFLEMALREHCRYTEQPCKPITGPKDSLELAGDPITDPPPCVTVGNYGNLWLPLHINQSRCWKACERWPIRPYYVFHLGAGLSQVMRFCDLASESRGFWMAALP